MNKLLPFRIIPLLVTAFFTSAGAQQPSAVFNVKNYGARGNGKIFIERMKAMRVNAYAASIESWKGGMFDEVILRDISIEYAGHPDAALSDVTLGQPNVNARNLPCWGWFVRNAKSITFENVNFHYAGTDSRPVPSCHVFR